MAGLNGTIEIKTAEYRSCMVEGKKALFHRWNHFSNVVGASPMIGGAPAGQISYTLGLVEYEDGTVEEVSPHKIKFLDTMWAYKEAAGHGATD